MFGRSPGLMALLLGPLTLLWGASSARAHRLNADYRALAKSQVEVEAWFDVTGDPAQGAEVRVYGAADQLLVTGKLDQQGRWMFHVDRLENLRVVVSAGAGHRRELRILAEELARASSDVKTGSDRPREASEHVDSIHDRAARIPWSEVLAGVGFLLALAAFVMSVRNARQLRALGDEARKNDSA